MRIRNRIKISMKQCIESNRRWWIFIWKKISHLSISAFFVSLCFLHICAHTKRQKTNEEKSRSDLKCLLVRSSIYAAKREENWSWRQKNTSSSIERERREKKMVRKNSEAFFYFFSCFAFACACACCVKRAITRRKEKNEIPRKKCGYQRERKLYGNCVTFYGASALDLRKYCSVSWNILEVLDFVFHRKKNFVLQSRTNLVLQHRSFLFIKLVIKTNLLGILNSFSLIFVYNS